jgi:hypothetical protein
MLRTHNNCSKQLLPDVCHIIDEIAQNVRNHIDVYTRREIRNIRKRNKMKAIHDLPEW